MSGMTEAFDTLAAAAAAEVDELRADLLAAERTARELRARLNRLTARTDDAKATAFRAAARQAWEDDDIAIDDDAAVSPTEDGAAWVQAWVFVSTTEET